MKTLFFIVALLIPVATTYASESEKNNKSTKNEPSDSIVNEQFDFTISNYLLDVVVSGEFDEHTFFSITQMKGEDMHFQSVQSGINHIQIDVSTLAAGNYYLILDSKNEIRMKRFSIEK